MWLHQILQMIEGDNLNQVFDGYGNTEVMNLPEPRIPDPDSMISYGSLCLIWVVMCWYGYIVMVVYF